MTEFLLICLSSSYMYIFSYIFILRHREESVRTIVTVLAGFSLTCVDVAISAGWNAANIALVAVLDLVVPFILMGFYCKGNIYKNYLIYFAASFLQQIFLAIVSAIAGVSNDEEFKQVIYDRHGSVKGHVQFFLISLISSVLAVLIFRLILRLWTDEKSFIYRPAAVAFIVIFALYAYRKLITAHSRDGMNTIGRIVFIPSLCTFLFAVLIYGRFRWRGYRKRRELYMKGQHQDEAVDRFVRRLSTLSWRSEINIFFGADVDRDYMTMAVGIMLEELGFIADSLEGSGAGKKKGKGRAAGDKSSGDRETTGGDMTDASEDFRVCAVNMYRRDGCLICSAELFGQMNPDRRLLSRLRYCVEDLGGILSTDDRDDHSRIVILLPEL
ncbi:MAG: hypothetical protein IJ703_02275 [Eubacterium sp.]|nr:hypothetical protein [Eubacterium sp.]